MRSADRDRDSQDKNLVATLEQYAKTAGLDFLVIKAKVPQGEPNILSFNRRGGGGGSKLSLILILREAIFPRYRPIFKIAIYWAGNLATGKVPEVVHIFFLPYGVEICVYFHSNPLHWPKCQKLIFHIFATIGSYGRKISNDISSESMHQINSPKIMHTPGEGLYQSCSKNCEISNFGVLPFFFSFSLTWYHMGVKASNDISSERTHQIRSLKFMATPGEGLYQSCSENSEI